MISRDAVSSGSGWPGAGPDSDRHVLCRVPGLLAFLDLESGEAVHSETFPAAVTSLCWAAMQEQSAPDEVKLGFCAGLLHSLL